MIHGVGAGDVIQGKVASSPQHEGFGMEYRLFLRRLVDAYISVLHDIFDIVRPDDARDHPGQCLAVTLKYVGQAL